MILRLAARAMGTRFELVLAGAVESRLRAAGEAALAEIEEWDRRLSLFRSDSLLVHLNARAAAGPVALDEDTFDLLRSAQALHRSSEGAFDPTVAPLMRAHGFHGPRAGATARRSAARSVGMGAVRLDPTRRTIAFERSGMALDLGAIGKGHGIELATAVLRECGVDCALLHGGTSTAAAIGAPPGAEGWRVALAPLEEGAPTPTVVLRDAALSVSAPRGRTLEAEEGRLGHVLDPATGEPAGAAALAAVTGPGARRCDALSTALLVRPSLLHRLPTGFTGLVAEDAAGPWRAAGAHPELFRLPETPCPCGA